MTALRFATICIRRVSGLLLTLLLSGSAAQAASLGLSSTMDLNTGLSESLVTGAITQIGFGNGLPGDADGLYDISNPATPFGALDIFPNEASFGVGSLDFDSGLVSGSGVETVAIQSLDLGSLWASGSATTDINDVALGNWLFSAPRYFSFGSLDASDTVTFTDGLLTSVDLDVAASFVIFDASLSSVSFDGALSIVGDTIGLSINDTENFDTGFGVVPTTFTSDLAGTVNAVGIYVVPEPGTGLLMGLGLMSLSRLRRGWGGQN